MRPFAGKTVVARIEQLEILDGVSERLSGGVDLLVPQESTLKDLLSGTWLGHPLHPALTDVVIGAWTSALVLDVIGGSETDRAADALVAVGGLAALPTATTGLSDWADTRGAARRVGSVHAIGNTAALVLNALSYRERRRGRRSRGVALSAFGFALATFSGWLGGHLSYGQGVGVNQTAFDVVPEEWTVVADEAALGDGELHRAEADGVGVLLVRRGERIHALADRCSHRGCGLHRGELKGDKVVCPCHGSTFSLADGGIVRGPATSPQPAFAVRVRDGKVEVSRA